jgi:hypothetical protein
MTDALLLEKRGPIAGGFLESGEMRDPTLDVRKETR